MQFPRYRPLRIVIENRCKWSDCERLRLLERRGAWTTGPPHSLSSRSPMQAYPAVPLFVAARTLTMLLRLPRKPDALTGAKWSNICPAEIGCLHHARLKRVELGQPKAHMETLSGRTRYGCQHRICLATALRAASALEGECLGSVAIAASGSLVQPDFDGFSECRIS